LKNHHEKTTEEKGAEAIESIMQTSEVSLQRRAPCKASNGPESRRKEEKGKKEKRENGIKNQKGQDLQLGWPTMDGDKNGDRTSSRQARGPENQYCN